MMCIRVSINGEIPIAGGFIQGKSQSKMDDDDQGTASSLAKLVQITISIVYDTQRTSNVLDNYLVIW